MADIVNGEIVTPTYVLNGVSSKRWIKPELSNNLSITGGNDLSCDADYCLTGTCATNYCGVTGCPSITRAFYNVSEEGEVYLVSADGIVYYLANDTDRMIQIYPINALQQKQSAKDAPEVFSTGVVDVQIGTSAIQFEVNTLSNELNLVVVPTHNRVIPWRPGTTNCNISVGEGYLNRKFVLQKRSQMTFPYSNGYFCVQTDYNRCVVFYKGELIYDGEYNGMGVPLSFSYGLERCLYGGNMGCCPKPQSSINWEYRVMPKWAIKDGKLQYETAVDKFLKSIQLYEKGKVINSNMFYWDKSSKSFVPFSITTNSNKTITYFADDSYQKELQEVTEEYQAIARDENGMPIYIDGVMQYVTKTRKVLKEVDYSTAYPGFRRFDIFVLDDNYVDGLSPYSIAYARVPLYDTEDYLRGTVGGDDVDVFGFIEEFRNLMNVIQKAGTSVNAKAFLELFKNSDGTIITDYLTIIKRVKKIAEFFGNSLVAFAKIVNQLDQLLHSVTNQEVLFKGIQALLEDEGALISSEFAEYQQLLSGLFNTGKEGGVRIWWSTTIGTGKDSKNKLYDPIDLKVFCGLRDEEKSARPIYSCESEMMYRCWETLQRTFCTDGEFGLSSSFLKWYSGIGYSEADDSADTIAPIANEDELNEQFATSESQDEEDDTQDKTINKHNTGNKPASVQTLWLSRWRNELCVYCSKSTSADDAEACKCTDSLLGSNPYTTNNNCKFINEGNNPGVCGKCNYPVTFESVENDAESNEEPCWIHVPDIPKVDAQGRQLNTEGKLLAVEGGEPAFENCLRVTYDEDGNQVDERGKFTHYCSVAVARVALDYLGGRVASVKYDDGTDSDWGFIRIGATDCRVKKDYTVVGQINKIEDLPGIKAKLIGEDGEEVTNDNLVIDENFNTDNYSVKYETNSDVANAVILRAPSSKDGDNETGCSVGFANGNGEIVFVMCDTKVEEEIRLRFYHIADNSWSCHSIDDKPPKFKLPTEKQLTQNKSGINDSYCADYCVTSKQYRSRTTANSVETYIETTTNIQGSSKLLYYKLNEGESKTVSKTDGKGRTFLVNSTTYTLQLGGKDNIVLYKYIPVKNIDDDGKEKSYSLDEPLDISSWYGYGDEVKVVNDSCKALNTNGYSLQFTRISNISVNREYESQTGINITTNFGQSSTNSGAEEYADSYNSTNEDLRPLVIYDVDKDFKNEFSQDWAGSGISNETIEKEETYIYNDGSNNLDTNVYSSNLYCTGVVKVTHKYTTTDNVNNLPGLKATEASKKIEHTDVYTITRYLYRNGVLDKKDSITDEMAQNSNAPNSTQGNNNSSQEEEEKVNYFWLEESANRVLTSKRIVRLEKDENAEGSFLKQISELCGSSSLSYILLLPIVAVTTSGVDDICSAIQAKADEIVNRKQKLRVDPIEVRREFMRFYPAFMTRPDYIPPLNEGVVNDDLKWIGSVEEEKCDTHIGVPSTSSDTKCTKNKVTSPVNVADCYYNVDTHKQLHNSNSKEKYVFKGFVNNWMLLKDKMESMANKLYGEEVQRIIKDKYNENIQKAKEEKKKKVLQTKCIRFIVYNNGITEQEINAKIENGTFNVADYLSEAQIQSLENSITESEYALTEQEKKACEVTVGEAKTLIENELDDFDGNKDTVQSLFEKPDKIVWYAKWEYSYEVDEENETTDETEEESSNTTTVKDICYIPVPSPSGTCCRDMVGDVVINEDTTGADGKIISTKKVVLITGYTVNDIGSVVAETETHTITKDDVGTWFCFGPCTDYDSGLSNYGGIEVIVGSNVEINDNISINDLPETSENPYTEDSGIKWIQAVNCWGDPHGIGIRGGTQMGDVYYMLGNLKVNEENNPSVSLDIQTVITAIEYQGGVEQYIHKDVYDEEQQNIETKTLEELDINSDRYWYWNGFQWVKGTTYFSDIDSEEVIFYKDKGTLNIAVSDSGERCIDLLPDTDVDVVTQDGTESATQIGTCNLWDKTIKLNVQGEKVTESEIDCNVFSKAIFKGRVKHKKACGDVLAVNLNTNAKYHQAVFLLEKPIWDRPAYSTQTYPEQKEHLRCLGSTYTALTYNTGEGKQCFRLWYHSYGKGEDNSSTVKFVREFEYDKVPDIMLVNDVPVSSNDVERYGADNVEKTYVTFLSIDASTLYVFYKGILIHTYDYQSDIETEENKNNENLKHTFEDIYNYDRLYSRVWGPIYCPILKRWLTSKDSRLCDHHLAQNFGNTNNNLNIVHSNQCGVYDLYYAKDGKYNIKANTECIIYLNGAFIEVMDYEWQDYYDNIAKEKCRILFKSLLKQAFYWLLCGCGNNKQTSGVFDFYVNNSGNIGKEEDNRFEFNREILFNKMLAIVGRRYWVACTVGAVDSPRYTNLCEEVEKTTTVKGKEITYIECTIDSNNDIAVGGTKIFAGDVLDWGKYGYKNSNGEKRTCVYDRDSDGNFTETGEKFVFVRPDVVEIESNDEMSKSEYIASLNSANYPGCEFSDTKSTSDYVWVDGQGLVLRNTAIYKINELLVDSILEPYQFVFDGGFGTLNKSVVVEGAERFAEECINSSDDWCRYNGKTINEWINDTVSCLIFHKLLHLDNSSKSELRLIDTLSNTHKNVLGLSTKAYKWKNEELNETSTMDELLYLVGDYDIRLSDYQYQEFYDYCNEKFWSVFGWAGKTSENFPVVPVWDSDDVFEIYMTPHSYFHCDDFVNNFVANADGKTILKEPCSYIDYLHLIYGDITPLDIVGYEVPTTYQSNNMPCWVQALFNSTEYFVTYNYKTQRSALHILNDVNFMIRWKPDVNCAGIFLCDNLVSVCSDYPTIDFKSPNIYSGSAQYHNYSEASNKKCVSISYDGVVYNRKAEQTSLSSSWCDYLDCLLEIPTVPKKYFPDGVNPDRIGSYNAVKEQYEDDYTKGEYKCYINKVKSKLVNIPRITDNIESSYEWRNFMSINSSSIGNLRATNVFVNRHDVLNTINMSVYYGDVMNVYFLTDAYGNNTHSNEAIQLLYGVLVYYTATNSWIWLPMQVLPDSLTESYIYADINQAIKEKNSALASQCNESTTEIHELPNYQHYNFDVLQNGTCALIQFMCSDAKLPVQRQGNEILFTVSPPCLPPHEWELKNKSVQIKRTTQTWKVIDTRSLRLPYNSQEECKSQQRTYRINEKGIEVLPGASFIYKQYNDGDMSVSSVLCPEATDKCKSLYKAYLESTTQESDGSETSTYRMYWGGVNLKDESGNDAEIKFNSVVDKKYHRIFVVCCDNYVVLTDGRVFYRTKYLFNVKDYVYDALNVGGETEISGTMQHIGTDYDYQGYIRQFISLLDTSYRAFAWNSSLEVPSNSDYATLNDIPVRLWANLNCCSMGAIIKVGINISGKISSYLCCAYIEGSPVYPFKMSDGKPKWRRDLGYTLGCCGYDYYWIQCGSFKDSIYYCDGIDNREGMYVWCSIQKRKRSYDNPSGTIYEFYSQTSDLTGVDEETINKINEWKLKYIDNTSSTVLKDEESAFFAILKRNVPLRELVDGKKAQIFADTVTDDKGNTKEIGDDVQNIDLTYQDEIYEEGRLVRTINHYRQVECPKQWSLCGSDINTDDGYTTNVQFEDDYSYTGYEKANQSNDLDDLFEIIKMEQVRFVPWRHKRTMEGRECFAYYRTTLISADPRITELCCCRYRNVNVGKEYDLDKCTTGNVYVEDSYKYTPQYHAISAYAVFEDNPFYNAWANGAVQEFYWDESTPSTIESAGSHKYFEYHYSETQSVQNVLGVKTIGNEHNAEGRILCDVDDYYVKRGDLNADNLIPCDNENPQVYDSATSGSLYDTGDDTKKFCNMKGITKEAQKNVCMIVWYKAKCQTCYANDINTSASDNGGSSGDTDNIPTYYKRDWTDWHKTDEPFDELWDGTSDDENRYQLVNCVYASGNGTSTEYWIRRLRSDVIYINDYNAACRWDRASGDDPIDDWQGTSSGEFQEVNGGFWTSAPDYHPIKDAYNENLSVCGRSRLVVSGNNTLYVFDNRGRTDYDIYNGKIRKYPTISVKGYSNG